MADAAPALSGGDEPDDAAAAMDVDEAVDQTDSMKVLRECVENMVANVVAQFPQDGERQRSAEPRVPRFPPTPAACCHAQTDDRCPPP